MIGIECVLVFFIPGVLLVLGTVLLIAQRGRGRFVGWFFIFMGVVQLGVLFCGLRVADHFLFHRKLISLTVADVVSINIADKTYPGPEQIARLVWALRQSEWFEPNHGGWCTLVPLTIRFKSGSEFHCHIAYYLKKNGAIVMNENHRFSGPMDFCPRLPEVLKELGYKFETPGSNEEKP